MRSAASVPSRNGNGRVGVVGTVIVQTGDRIDRQRYARDSACCCAFLYEANPCSYIPEGDDGDPGECRRAPLRRLLIDSRTPISNGQTLEQFLATRDASGRLPTRIFRWQDRCYQLGAKIGVDQPPGTTPVPLDGEHIGPPTVLPIGEFIGWDEPRFPDPFGFGTSPCLSRRCHTGYRFVEAFPCTLQEGPVLTSLGRVFVCVTALQGVGTRVFRYTGFCWCVSENEAIDFADLPEDANLITAIDQFFIDCEDCRRQADPPPDEEDQACFEPCASAVGGRCNCCGKTCVITLLATTVEIELIDRGVRSGYRVTQEYEVGLGRMRNTFTDLATGIEDVTFAPLDPYTCGCAPCRLLPNPPRVYFPGDVWLPACAHPAMPFPAITVGDPPPPSTLTDSAFYGEFTESATCLTYSASYRAQSQMFRAFYEDGETISQVTRVEAAYRYDCGGSPPFEPASRCPKGPGAVPFREPAIFPADDLP